MGRRSRTTCHLRWTAVCLVALPLLRATSFAAELASPAWEESTTAVALGASPAWDWYLRGEAFWLTRGRPESLVVSAVDTSGLGDMRAVLNASDLEFHYQPGLRLTLGRRLDDCNRLELGYFGLQDLHSHREVTDADAGLISVYGGLQTGMFFAGVVGFDWANLHRIEYESQLQNVECNLRHETLRGGSLDADVLVGLRVMSLNERFLFTSVQPGGGPGGIDAYGSAENYAYNTLLGGQLGGELLYHVTPRLDLSARANGGLFLNFAGHNSNFIQEMGAINRADYTASEEVLAGLVQVGVTAQYHLTARLVVQGGYDVLLLSGLALASEQFDARSGYLGATLHDDGTAVFHGPSAGLQWQW